MNDFFHTRKIGKNAEDLACRYLKSRGYRILKRNYFIRGGEIDIIASQGKMVVFIEVKMRFNHSFGSAQESITSFKMAALYKAAQVFVVQRKLWDRPLRFDLIAINFDRDTQKYEIDHLLNFTQ